jgi:2-succinyl-5-enolpyruvyl-6-hydroxy-3-cyclohexene-1-carboxylate synthase
VSVSNALLAPSLDLVDDLARDLTRHPHGLIIAGPQNDPDLAPGVTRLAARLGYPVLADALSGVRCGRHDRTMVIDTYDAFLRDAATAGSFVPEVLLRLGAIPTSKPLQQYLQAQLHARLFVVDPGGWREPTSQATDILHVDPRVLCDALTAAVSAQPGGWAEGWLATNAAARHALDAHLSVVDELFEGKVFAELVDLLPDGALVYAGNSMPVRDLDTFLPQSDKGLRFLANRGANGIDGVVSSAFGASASRIAPVVLVIGDISFYHDLNGLLAARKHDLDLVVVLLNNDGGGIFSFLPQSESAADNFELLFGTPHGLDFRPFVEGYGGDYVRVDEWPAFRAAVSKGLRRGGLQVVEVPTHRVRNVEQHRAVCSRCPWRDAPQRTRVPRRGRGRRSAVAAAPWLHGQRAGMGRPSTGALSPGPADRARSDRSRPLAIPITARALHAGLVRIAITARALHAGLVRARPRGASGHAGSPDCRCPWLLNGRSCGTSFRDPLSRARAHAHIGKRFPWH